MKDFLVMTGLIIFLMFFPVQYGINQINHYNMEMVNEEVHKAAQTARTDGYFTIANINNLRSRLAAKLYLTGSDITINATTTPKYRLDSFDHREMISYEVRVPIKRILALNTFFGIADSTNKSEYVIQESVPSEKLMP